MALLFSDPLAFRPDFSTPSAPSGLRTLVQNWNQTTNAATIQTGTFNRPFEQGHAIDQQLEQLEQIRTRMENLQQPGVNMQRDRTIHSRRIKQQPTGVKQTQLLEPIPIVDLDHPLNTWMLHNKAAHLGPLATKNNSDWPILPQFIVSTLSNGTLVQLPVSFNFSLSCCRRRDINYGTE